jgi:uncharacterized membrane protein
VRNARAIFYFVLSGTGLVTAWYFNAMAVLRAQDYAQAWFSKEVDWVLSLDLLIVAVAAVSFMVYEARRLGMKRVWLYIALSGITAISATFPFFLAMRELKLAKIVKARGEANL